MGNEIKSSSSCHICKSYRASRSGAQLIIVARNGLAELECP